MNLINSFGTITIPAITRYLKLQGWVRRVDFPNPKLIVFDGPNDRHNEAIQIVLPSDENYLDYPTRLQELLDSLSDMEERPVTAIIKDIKNPNID